MELLDYERVALDRARSLINPLANGQMTYEQARAYVNSRLPEGDPGRM